MIVDLPSRGGGQGRVLYWFRTPPGVRVGAVPLDEETRRLIETRHPEIRFDWRQILSGRPAGGDPPSSPARPQARPAPPSSDGAGRRRRRERRPAPGRQPEPVDTRSSDEPPEDPTPSHE